LKYTFSQSVDEKSTMLRFYRERHIWWKCLRIRMWENHLWAAPIRHGDSVIIIMRCSPDRENNKGGTADWIFAPYTASWKATV